jgi:tetratricopeptide (TPR) repeat protein
MNMTDFQKTETEFIERMSFDDINEALRMIEPWMIELHQLDDPALRQRVLSRFAEVAALKYGGSLGETASSAAKNPAKARVLHQLGYELQDRRLYAMSASVLWLAYHQNPDNAAVLTELASALEQQGLYEEAYNLMDNADLGTNYLPRYLLAFNAIMIGRTEQAKLLLPALDKFDESHELFMTGRIRRMVERENALAHNLPSALNSARGRHFIQSGGLLVVESAHDHDTYAQLGMVLAAMKTALTTWNMVPSRLMSVPDTNSRVLAAALGTLWDAPVEDWYATPEAGLIVMYQSEKALTEIRSALKQKPPGQVFFAYTATAKREHPASPEILGFRGTEHTPVWQPLPDEDDEFSLFADTPEPPPPSVIIQSIIDHIPASLDDPSLMGMITFMQAIKEGDGIFTESHERESLWVLPNQGFSNL